MTLREQLAIINRYAEKVREGAVDIILCPMDQSVLLHYVDKDEVYLKCTHCERVTYPGSFFFRALKNAIKQSER